MTWKADSLGDFIILRSDQHPTYHLSVVCDDVDMAVTHVIRGDDHLTNAARQTQIYQALGWGYVGTLHVHELHTAALPGGGPRISTPVFGRGASELHDALAAASLPESSRAEPSLRPKERVSTSVRR